MIPNFEIKQILHIWEGDIELYFYMAVSESKLNGGSFEGVISHKEGKVKDFRNTASVISSLKASFK